MHATGPGTTAATTTLTITVGGLVRKVLSVSIALWGNLT